MTKILLHENAQNYATAEQLERDKATALVNYAAGIFDAITEYNSMPYIEDSYTEKCKKGALLLLKTVEEICESDDVDTIGEFLELAENVTYNQRNIDDALVVIQTAEAINEYNKATKNLPHVVVSLDEYLKDEGF